MKSFKNILGTFAVLVLVSVLAIGFVSSTAFAQGVINQDQIKTSCQIDPTAAGCKPDGFLGGIAALISANSNGSGLSPFQRLATSVANFIIGIIVAFSVFGVLWGAFDFLRGKPDDGAKRIKNSIIALVIALLSLGGVAIVTNILRGL